MHRTRHRLRRRAADCGAALPLLLALVLAGCGGGASPSEGNGEGECEWTGAGASTYSIEKFVSDTLTGTQTRWDHNLRLISLGPEEVGDGEPDIALTMTLGEPSPSFFGCAAWVTWANLVAHEVQVGTGPEIGARYYELIGEGCNSLDANAVTIKSIGRDAIVVSSMCLALQRIIVHPNGSTELGEIVNIEGSFTALAR